LTADKICALERVAAESTNTLERTATWWREEYYNKGKPGDAFALIYDALSKNHDLYSFELWGKERAFS
jgi:hypothetical protein